MTLLRNGTYPNPIGANLPPAPVAAAAPSLAPAQGDHIFGDVIGVINTAFQQIFGGGALVAARIESYDSTLASVWNGLAGVNLGHGAAPPVTQRNGVAEPDEHSHMFGGYSNRLQWQLCEIVSTGFHAGAEDRYIGGATAAWKKAVLASFDDLMNNLVDSTAIAFYIATPNAIRNASAATRHTPMSLANALTYTNNNAGPGKAAVSAVLASYGSLRNALAGILDRLSGPTQRWDAAKDKFVPL